MLSNGIESDIVFLLVCILFICLKIKKKAHLQITQSITKKFSWIYCIKKSSYGVKCEIILTCTTLCKPLEFGQLIQMYVWNMLWSTWFRGHRR